MQQVGDVQLQNADSYFSHYAFLSLEAIKLPTKLATKAFIIYTWQDKANTHPPYDITRVVFGSVSLPLKD